MRKLLTSAVALAALTLAGCGDETAPSATTTGPSENSAPAEEGGEIADLSTALLAAEDLPQGAVMGDPLDLAQYAEKAAQAFEGMTFDPAECGGTEGPLVEPYLQEGVAASGMSASIGSAFDTVTHVVFAEASAEDFAALVDRVDTCGKLSMTGRSNGVDVSASTTTALGDAPAVDADDIVVLDVEISRAAVNLRQRFIYLRDGEYGIYLSAPQPTDFDLDALAVTALERLRTARG